MYRFESVLRLSIVELKDTRYMSKGRGQLQTFSNMLDSQSFLGPFPELDLRSVGLSFLVKKRIFAKLMQA